MKRFIDKLLIVVFLWCVNRVRGGWGSCADRSWRRFRTGKFDITVQFRDTSKEPMYSREELYCMLSLIRIAEATYCNGWKVPEPDVRGCRLEYLHGGVVVPEP